MVNKNKKLQQAECRLAYSNRGLRQKVEELAQELSQVMISKDLRVDF